MILFAVVAFDFPLFVLEDDNRCYSLHKRRGAQDIRKYYVIKVDKIFAGSTYITKNNEEERVKEYQLVLHYSSVGGIEPIIEGFGIIYNQGIKIELIRNGMQNGRFVATLKLVSDTPVELINSLIVH